MKLKTQLTGGFALALLVPLVISTLFFTFNFRALLSERVTDTELPAILKSVRNGLELELSPPISTSSDMANNPFITNWLAEGEPDASQASVTRYLNELQSRYQAISAYVIHAESGHYYNQGGRLKTLSQDNQQDAWFYNFLASNKPFELSLDTDTATGEATLFVNYRLGNGQQGIAGIGRSLANMAEIIRSYKIGESGEVYLIDAKGTIKLHRNTDLINRPMSQISPVPLAHIRKASQDTLSHSDMTRDGEDFVSAAIKMQSLDWYVVAEVPKAQFFAAINHAILINILISLTLAGLFLLLARLLTNKIVAPIHAIHDAITDITDNDGDLTARIDCHGTDEVLALGEQVNKLINQLQSLCLNILSSAQSLSEASAQVSHLMVQTAEQTDHQQRSTDLVAVAVNEMGATVQGIAQNASHAAETSKNTQKNANQGLTVVDSTVQEINQLAGSMTESVESVENLANEIKSISALLDVISSISEQTNLLALNAAIEAARAGEQGRGFAVVADEVRTLAARTAQSTEEIHEMISRLESIASTTVTQIQAGDKLTQSSVASVTQTGELLSDITTQINHISDLNLNIATATDEQSSVTEEMNENVTEIASHAKATSENVTACRNLCVELESQAEHLNTLMARFTLK